MDQQGPTHWSSFGANWTGILFSDAAVWTHFKQAPQKNLNFLPSVLCKVSLSTDILLSAPYGVSSLWSLQVLPNETTTAKWRWEAIINFLCKLLLDPKVSVVKSIVGDLRHVPKIMWSEQTFSSTGRCLLKKAISFWCASPCGKTSLACLTGQFSTLKWSVETRDSPASSLSEPDAERERRDIWLLITSNSACTWL